MDGRTGACRSVGVGVGLPSCLRPACQTAFTANDLLRGALVTECSRVWGWQEDGRVCGNEQLHMATARPSLRSRVRALYKQIIFAGRDYPAGLDAVRTRAKQEFARNAHLTDNEQILEALARGRWYLRELEATNRLHKYRALKNRYYD